MIVVEVANYTGNYIKEVARDTDDCGRGGKDGRTPGEEILSIHRTCDLELSSPLYQAFFFTLLSQN